MSVKMKEKIMSNLSITQYVNNDIILKNIQDVLKDRTPQFITSVVSLVNSSDALKEADKKSVLGACLTAASLNLPINQNLGYAYIIPYKDNKKGVTVAQFQMGYKGYIQLAMRSGQFQTLNVTDVREGELKEVDRLSGEMKFEWATEKRDSLPVVGYVGYFRLINGFEKKLYMTSEELKKHGVRFSSSYKRGYGLWKDDFDAMAKKTVIKLLLSKYAPMNTEMTQAQEADQALVTDNGYEYIDNQKLTPEEEADIKEKERIKKFITEAKTLKNLEACNTAVYDSTDQELIDMYEARVKELEGKK